MFAWLEHGELDFGAKESRQVYVSLELSPGLRRIRVGFVANK